MRDRLRVSDRFDTRCRRRGNRGDSGGVSEGVLLRSVLDVRALFLCLEDPMLQGNQKEIKTRIKPFSVKYNLI